MVTKALQDTLKQLINEHHMHDHHEIQEALRVKGFAVSQSKLSRLMRQWHIIKQTDESGEAYYVVQPEQSIPHPKMAIGQLVSSVEHNNHMIVIRTSPGSASLIARLLDHRRDRLSVLGAVAGDDTIFLTPTADAVGPGLDELVELIRSFLFTS